MSRRERDSAVPWAEVRRTSGRAFPRDRARRRRVVGRLLLELRAVHDVVPARGEDRRTERACSLPRQAAQGRPAARSHHHAADRARSPRDSGRATGERDAPVAAGTCDRGPCSGHPPRRPGAQVRGPALPDMGTSPHKPDQRQAGGLLPRLRNRVLRARWRREGRRRPRAQRLPRRDSGSGLLWAAAAVEWPVRGRAEVRLATCPCPGPARPRWHIDRRQLDELHADAQARGARDSRSPERSRPGARQPPDLRHLRAAARASSIEAS